MGVNPISYLAMPRFIAMAVMVPALVVYFDLCGIFGGWFMAYMHKGVALDTYFNELLNQLDTMEVIKSLIKTMKASGDPLVPLTVRSYEPRFFQIEADVQVDPDYIENDVLTAVETELRARFSFEQRAFGQHVA